MSSKSLLLASGLAGGMVALLLLTPGGSTAQEAEPEQRTQLVAALDITPLQQELAALRAELAAIRAAVADADGLRKDVGQAAAAIKTMSEEVTTLATTVRKYTETTGPVIQALKPSTGWEYKLIRSRSESACNRLGREGWFLAAGGDEWLYFRRPIPTPPPNR